MSESPAHSTLGALADIVMGQSPPSSTVFEEERGLPFLQGCAEFGSRHPRPKLHCDPPLRVAKAGSTLISVRAPVGTMNVADQDYCIGRGLGSVAPRAGIADARFLQYAIENGCRYLHRRSQGSTFLAIGSADVHSMPIPTFDVENQRRIAEILSTVDEAIEHTEALIAKTQQIKTGLMHDLFTRGVTPDGHLRPPRDQAPELYKQSPLGWIPREWESPSLSEIADLQVGFAFSSALFQPNGINLLRGENVGYGKPNWKDRQCLPPEIARHFPEYLLHADDIVIGMDRTFTKSGVKVSVVSSEDCPALLVQRVGRFVPTDCESEYLRCLIRYQGYLTALIAQQKGMDIPHLSSSEILAPRVPVPLPDEQRRIATRVSSIMATTEAALGHSQKLDQLKSGLMQKLLSGSLSKRYGA